MLEPNNVKLSTCSWESEISTTSPDTSIDKFTFFGVLIILFMIVVPLTLYPKQGAEWVGIIKDYVTHTFGVLYLGIGILSLIFITYIAFSDFGSIKAGKPEEEAEFSTCSWAAMLFCAGIGASILYWSLIEWAYYYQKPPFHLEPGSPEAIRWATSYGMFHWGPVAWAIYLVPAVPIAYFYHVRNNPVLKISQCLAPIIGGRYSSSYWTRMIDILFIFGMLGGGATTLGLASPLITEGLYELTGLPITPWTRLGVLLFTTAIFSYSAYSGLKSGIKLFSNINFYMALLFLLFVLIVGPTAFILNAGIEGLGRSISQMVKMMTWIEAFGEFENYGFKKTNFPQNWTIFYWAWWLVFAPTIGLFIARISKGRTLRQMIVGSLFFGSLGCAVFFIVLGNYGLHLQLSGSLDVISILNDTSPTAAIFAILNTLPMAKAVIVVFTVLAILFTATTFDSIAYILASVVQKEIDDEPHRWNRLFWAGTLCLLPSCLMFIGDLQTLQTASIISGLPLIFIMIAMMIATIKAAKFDLWFQPDYTLKTIHIEEIAETSPWEEGETSPAPEGSVLHQEATFEEIRQKQSNDV